jgi:hypothetical protein
MPVPRRDFMKLFGISLGSLLLARCQVVEKLITPPSTCYAVALDDTALSTPAKSPTSKPLTARDRLRQCWLRFGELAQKTVEARDSGENSWENNPIGAEMEADHRSALDELVAAGEITAPVADLIQEAFSAAVYHIWRSNVPMTCYEPVMVDYAPASAGSLVQQSEALTDVAAGSTIAPDTLAKARVALEHDLAFYALTDAEVQVLYEQLLKEYQDSGGTIPSFEEVELTLTPEVKTAAQFLLDVLMGI